MKPAKNLNREWFDVLMMVMMMTIMIMMMSNSFHLADDGLFVPALDIVPLDAVAVEVVQDPDAPLVLAALLGLPVLVKVWWRQTDAGHQMKAF